MTELLCLKRDHDIFEDVEKLYNYLATFKNDKNIDKAIVIENIDLDNIEEILNNHIEIHNKKFNIYFLKCLFNIRFDDDIHELHTVYIHNKEIYKILLQLLFFIDMMNSNGKFFISIDKMTININSDLCNMSDIYSRYMRLSSIERRINIIFGKNPQLLNKISNDILIKNKSHIIFNI